LALAALGEPAAAVMPDEIMSDPALEARARSLSAELRCLVCQNQSIDDSAAPLARDIRLLVRERLKAGDSDAQAIDYIVARYGNFVLLRPPFQADTLVLWLGPVAVLIAAAATFTFYLRRRNSDPQSGPMPLTAAERAELAGLTKDD
jgi:cytochrome c-type biogenesis protein CcmH